LPGQAVGGADDGGAATLQGWAGQMVAFGRGWLA
jgi:hypothetical protein